MLHELLLALNGHHGGLFVKDEDDNIQVSMNTSYLSPSEVSMLNRICLLATHFTYFQSFIRRHSAFNWSPEKNNGIPLGNYVKALADVLQVQLSSYRQRLLELEQQLLADNSLTAAYLHGELSDFQSIFPPVQELLLTIEDNQLSGCQILEKVEAARHHGNRLLTDFLNRLNQRLLLCFYKQLSSWCLHGKLVDQFAEFPVQSDELPPVERSALSKRSSQAQEMKRSSHAQETATSQLDSTDGASLSTVFLGSEGGGHRFHSAVSSDVGGLLSALSVVDDRHKSQKFSLHVAMLPGFISNEIAHKILFIGESVRMLNTSVTAESCFKEEEEDFSKKFYTLSEKVDFNVVDLEKLINEIHCCVTGKLHHLMMQTGNLLKHLRDLKDFYLLGRGELFHAFVEHSACVLDHPINPNRQFEVNAAFRRSAASVLLGNDEIVERFKVIIDGCDVKAVPGWNQLNLRYRTEWPTEVLLTDSIFKKYNRLFKFLLGIRRVQMALESSWLLTQLRSQRSGGDDRSVLFIRNRLILFINNLLYFLQVNVIESQFSTMISSMQKTTDFDVLAQSHNTFLSFLFSHSFLLSPMILSCLMEILKLCSEFANLHDDNSQFSLLQVEKTLAIGKEFELRMAMLFNLLQSHSSHQALPQLAQFLLRLDYNSFYSRSGISSIK